MNGTLLKANKHAISTLAVAIIIIIVVGAVVAVAVLAALLGFWQPLGQVVGSGTLETEQQAFVDFVIVEVGWGFEVEIDQSDSYSVNITADDNVFDYIEVSQTGDTLAIGLKWGYSYQSVTLKARITMPNLHELKLAGGSLGTLQRISSSHAFAVDLSGGSRLSGEFTTSEAVQFTLSGGSHLIYLDGAADDLTVSGSGGSLLGLSDFLVHDVTITLSGGSSATVSLDGRLQGDVSGGSHLKYVGTPTAVDVTTSGGSRVGP